MSPFESQVMIYTDKLRVFYLASACSQASGLKFNPLTAKLFNRNFHPPTDAIHNFKWVKIIQIWQQIVNKF